MSAFPNHWYAKPPCLIDLNFVEQVSSLLCSVSEIPHNSLTVLDMRINFAYLSISILSSLYMHNGVEGLRSIILAGQHLLVKMFITLELHGKI